MKNNVINKGNYSMETLDRELLFETFKAEGWEEDYLAYRKKWCEQPEQRFVSEYPLLVDSGAVFSVQLEVSDVLHH